MSALDDNHYCHVPCHPGGRAKSARTGAESAGRLSVHKLHELSTKRMVLSVFGWQRDPQYWDARYGSRPTSVAGDCIEGVPHARS